uniref:tRNA pseudouridine(55) synthase n=1 Tax=Ditylum brightwellii TaxID=49249 RepID=A0A7S1YZL7_9STRA|mmetsp:Transcript_20863/g.31021  ORF Transcript_20863/g.31021 Transcript_20863/m.31021 type:complete len:715 (+) Transcript_20863:212-2356(+)
MMNDTNKSNETKNQNEENVTLLLQKCNVCHICIKLLSSRTNTNNDTQKRKRLEETPEEEEEEEENNINCTLCFNLLSTKTLSQTKSLISDQSKPYAHENENALQTNYISSDSPTLFITPLIMIRAHALSVYLHHHHPNVAKQLRKSVQDYYESVKEYIRSSLREFLFPSSNATKRCKLQHASTPQKDIPYTRELHKEESGYLSLHIVFLPPSSTTSASYPYPTELLPTLHSYQCNKRKDRKRFRGNDPTNKQGGNPRTNLEKRVQRQLQQLQVNNDNDKEETTNALWLDRNDTLKAIQTDTITMDINKQVCFKYKEKWVQWFDTIKSSSYTSVTDVKCNHIQVAIWRKPYYISGFYTKHIRTVSQTPFYVPYDDSQDKGKGNETTNEPKKGMVKKGTSSIEEEICPVLAKVGCGGISVCNNEEIHKKDEESKNDNKSKLVYGMCKFHASGREDMDVRMLLPFDETICAHKNEEGFMGGRPFVCEVIDAYHMPTQDDLERVVAAVNHDDTTSANNDTEHCKKKDTDEDDNAITPSDKWEEIPSIRYFGSNPNGVGISSNIHYVPSSAFRNLQSNTEDKVKHYGCLVWSCNVIPTQSYLNDKLGFSPPSSDHGSDAMTPAKSAPRYPLEIAQSTPLRVLHRRSSQIRKRHILSLVATRLSSHWFLLRISTSAGTYVKEFVHGDCGRTSPSVSSMLGSGGSCCKTDIYWLDCEGIDV